MGIRQHPNGYWYADGRVNGKRLRESLNTKSKQEAEERWFKLRQAAKDEVIRGEDPERWTAQQAPAKVMEEYLEDLARRKLSAQHIGQRRRQLEKILVSLNVATVRGMTTARIARALGELHEVSPRTANDYRAAIHGLFQYLVDQGRWHRNPVKPIRKAKELDEPRRRALTPDELARLLASAPRHRSILYRLSAGLGLRRSELAALTPEQFDFEGLYLTLRAEKTKARKGVMLPFTAELADALKDWMANPEILETGNVRGGSHRTWERSKRVEFLPAPPGVRTFERDLIAAGIPLEVNGMRLVFHSLRATYITDLWRSGASAAEVCRYGRLKDVKTALAHYTRLAVSDDEIMRERLSKLHAPSPGGQKG
jgi:integrase